MLLARAAAAAVEAETVAENVSSAVGETGAVQVAGLESLPLVMVWHVALAGAAAAAPFAASAAAKAVLLPRLHWPQDRKLG